MKPQDLVSYVLMLYGKGPQSIGKVRIQPYAFTARFDAFAPGAANAQTQQFQVNANGDFLWTQFSYQCFANPIVASTAATDIVPPVRIQMSDGSTGQNYFDRALYLPAIAGLRTQPNEMPYPRLIQGASTVNVNATNLDNAATFNLELLFEGVLINWME